LHALRAKFTFALFASSLTIKPRLDTRAGGGGLIFIAFVLDEKTLIGGFLDKPTGTESQE
jgi:hypothetical protein